MNIYNFSENKDKIIKFNDNKKFPIEINNLLIGKFFKKENIGMSSSKILIFKDMVLKIQPNNIESQNEVKIMKWLKNCSYFPKIIKYENTNDFSYLLMTKIKGKMSCDEKYMSNGNILIKALVDGLKFLWSFDISNCPFVHNLNNKIKQIEQKINKGLINLEDVNLDFFLENKFQKPKDLLDWLIINQPKVEELVLSHGDYCLPNIFINENIFSGFVDIGQLGIADKWLDIAICYRSLKSNVEGKYDGKKYDINPNFLFNQLKIEPNWDKIRFYILLDELI